MDRCSSTRRPCADISRLSTMRTGFASWINHIRLGEVAIGGTVGQLPYKPFTTPQRAAHEEFGDILTYKPYDGTCTKATESTR